MEAQGAALEDLQSVHVERRRIADDLVEEVFAEADLLSHSARSPDLHSFHQNAVQSAMRETMNCLSSRTGGVWRRT